MKYYFDLEGEDHSQFVWECEANSRNDAMKELDEVYPDAKMLDMQSHDEYIERENFRYERLAYEMDNDCDLSGDIWL